MEQQYTGMLYTSIDLCLPAREFADEHLVTPRLPAGLKIWQPQEITLRQIDLCFSPKDWGKFLVLGPLLCCGRFDAFAGMYLASFGHYILTFSAFRALRGSKVWSECDTWKSWVAGFKELHPSQKRPTCPQGIFKFKNTF